MLRGPFFSHQRLLTLAAAAALGKTLAAVARMRNESPEDAALDLVIEDGSRVSTIDFLMSEDNLCMPM